MVTRSLTSLMGVFLAIVCVVSCISPTIDETQRETSPVHSSSVHRVKRQFGGNGFDNFGGNFNGGRRFGPNRRRPFSFPNQNGNDDNFGDPSQFQPQQQQFNGGKNELIFGNGRRPNNGGGNSGFAFVTTTAAPTSTTAPTQNPNANNPAGQIVVINNRPVLATMAPFIARTTATPQFIACFNSCPTTSEYNPICGSDMELYHNEQKFNCARRCGNDIQIVRRGSCEGLFPMMRG